MHFKHTLVAFCAVVTAALGTFSPAAAEDKGQVVVASYGGTYQDALRVSIFKPFEQETGIKLVEATGPSLPKIRAMVQAGSPEWDVVDTIPSDYLRLIKEGALQQLDYGAMDSKTFADFPKEAVQPYGVGAFVYSKIIGFNTKKYTQANGPKSWADFWDVQKFPGPRTMNAGNSFFRPDEMALLADGVPADKLYPLDLKRAYASLARLKPYVVKWTTSGAMATDALVSGEVVMAPVDLGRILQLKEQGAPVDFVWNQALNEQSSWTVLKGTKNYKNALKFIEYASRAESQARFVKLQALGPLNKKAFQMIPPERAKLLPTYPENLEKSIPLSAEWWAETDSSGKSNLEKNLEMWNDFSLKQ